MIAADQRALATAVTALEGHGYVQSHRLPDLWPAKQYTLDRPAVVCWWEKAGDDEEEDDAAVDE